MSTSHLNLSCNLNSIDVSWLCCWHQLTVVYQLGRPPGCPGTRRPGRRWGGTGHGPPRPTSSLRPCYTIHNSYAQRAIANIWKCWYKHRYRCIYKISWYSKIRAPVEYVIRPHSCQISIYLWLRISLVSFQTFIYVSITNDWWARGV